ncbi:alpha/beta fold hydrolase [Corynebacterium sp. A21]|uniref:alpha/beta fold hydrolase n=1 Tax=Corynebacterium sp. A21 TaxID=3457318 RepID=UPI003FD31EB5
MTLFPTHTIGTGPHAVLCLSGWFGHSKGWGPWAENLDTENYSWLFPDYRGYGSQVTYRGDFTIDEVTEELHTLLDSLRTYESVTVLGHSMGGVFAQHLLTKAGGKIAAYIGISSVSAAGTPMPPEQRDLFESAGDSVDARQMIIDITTGQRLSDRWLASLAQATTQTSSDDAVAGYFRAWADCNFLDELGVQEIPALVIVGAHDPAVTVESSQQAFGEVFPDLSIIEFPDAGHYSMFESPIRLLTEVERFLNTRVLNR